jgi:uncharacterized membrane protein YhaH (DUF805 family)
MLTDRAVPRFSDARVSGFWILATVVPIVVATFLATALLPRPEPAFAAGILGAIALGIVFVVGFFWGRLPPRP